MIKWIKRILITLILLVVAGVLAIELNKETIIKKVVNTVNEGLTTPISYQSAGVSFLSTFPSIGVKLRDVSIDSEQDDTPSLMKLGTFQVNVNIVEALQNKVSYSIKKLKLADGTITAYTDLNGKTNYDISKESSGESNATNISLESFEVDQINLRYINTQTKVNLNVEDINANGSIDYLDQNVDVDLEYDAIVDGPLAIPT